MWAATVTAGAVAQQALSAAKPAAERTLAVAVLAAVPLVRLVVAPIQALIQAPVAVLIPAKVSVAAVARLAAARVKRECDD